MFVLPRCDFHSPAADWIRVHVILSLFLAQCRRMHADMLCASSYLILLKGPVLVWYNSSNHFVVKLRP